MRIVVVVDARGSRLLLLGLRTLPSHSAQACAATMPVSSRPTRLTSSNLSCPSAKPRSSSCPTSVVAAGWEGGRGGDVS